MQMTPGQTHAYEGVLNGLSVANFVSLSGSHGSGKSSILKAVQQKTGGQRVHLGHFFRAMKGAHPSSLEETFVQMVLDRAEAASVVLLDDLDLLLEVVDACGSYPRANLLESYLSVLAKAFESADKKLVTASRRALPEPLRARSYNWHIRDMDADDYQFLLTELLGKKLSKGLNARQIHRFAPRLNVYQVRSACHWLAHHHKKLTTEEVVDYLRSQGMASNVDLGEVQKVELSDLRGLDDVIAQLEAHVILPLENDQLAEELGLVPKRGVLLAGPPGTGKTTVGRALAHRLKSKFFLIDGTCIAGTGNFYGQVHRIFQAAKDNSPSIIFLDDGDVIFQDGEEMGLYRYLLTMLDGLESEGSARVCLMMTAMDVSSLPPALIRSGRVELYLHTRLPDFEARRAILESRLAQAPADLAGVDLGRLAEACDELTGADLKRLVEDTKLLYAYDVVKKKALASSWSYFERALEKLREQKAHYHEAEERARARPVRRDPMAEMMAHLHSQAFLAGAE